MRALGDPENTLGAEEITEFVRECFSGLDLVGRSLCLVIPDATRICPLL